MYPFFILAIYLLSLPSIYASPIPEFYFFGDSLTDSGYQNNNPKVIKLGKSPQWTSPQGHTWPYYFLKRVEHHPLIVANNMDAALFYHPVPKYILPILDGNNFAAGGSTTGGTGILNTSVYKSPSLLQQVDYFLHTYVPKHQVILAENEYFIWSGDNDLVKRLTRDIKVDYILGKLYMQKLAAMLHLFDMQHLSRTFSSTKNEIANHLLTTVTMLQHAGAKKIIVILLPDISETPLINNIALNLQKKAHSKITAKELSTQLHAVVMDTNALIKEKLRHTGAILIDVNDILRPLSAMTTPGYFNETPRWFGQKRRFYIANNTNGACRPNQLALTCIPSTPHAKHFVFEDLVHPTDQTHQMLGDYIYYQSRHPTKT